MFVFNIAATCQIVGTLDRTAVSLPIRIRMEVSEKRTMEEGSCCTIAPGVSTIEIHSVGCKSPETRKLARNDNGDNRND